MAENLNTKIYDEVKESLDVRASVVDDLRDCVYLSRITSVILKPRVGIETIRSLQPFY